MSATAGLVPAVGVSWSDIAADAPRYLAAAEGDRNATVAVEFFQPWPRYPYTSAGGPTDPAAK